MQCQQSDKITTNCFLNEKFKQTIDKYICLNYVLYKIKTVFICLSEVKCI